MYATVGSERRRAAGYGSMDGERQHEKSKQAKERLVGFVHSGIATRSYTAALNTGVLPQTAK